MSYIEQTKERTFIIFEPEFLTNLIHIGKLHYTGARPALPLHQHKDILEICYVYRGNPVFQVGGEDFPLKGGDVFLSFPNEVHSTGKYPQDKMILYWLGIKIEGLDNNFMQFHDSKEANAFLQALIGLKARKFRGSKELKVLLDEVLTLYFSKHTFKKILIRNRITDFLALLIDFEKKSHDSGISPLIENSIIYIKQNLSEQIKIENLAELANLSIPRFKQRFKDETGVPPGEFMLRSKIEKASEALSEATKEITTIAFDLGFSSSQYFATVFKRFTNCSPSEYRRKTQINPVICT